MVEKTDERYILYRKRIKQSIEMNNMRGRLIMLQAKAAAVIISVAMVSPVLADDTRFTLPSLGDQETARWHSVDGSMAQNEYGQAVRHNKRIIQRATRNYLEGGLISMGASKKAIEITGATVGFLVDGGKLNLNDSKTFSLEVRDVVDNDRGMFLKYKLNW